MSSARVHYEHRQFGWAIVVALVVTLVCTDLGLVAGGATAGALTATVFCLALLLLFSTLTVRVGDARIEASFGVGAIKRRIAISDIRSYRAVKNSWIAGWGIHLFPGGVLYNVSGLDAVELALSSGRRVRIGTDEPAALVAAIAQVAGERATRSPPLPAPKRSAVRVGLVLAAVAAIPVVLAVLFALEMRDPRVRVDRTRLDVASTLYDASVPLADVTSVSLVAAPPPGGVRTNGFALGGLLRGHFRLSGYGDGMVFANRNVPPYVLVRTRDSYLLVGFDDPARTRSLFDQISQARSE